MRINDGGFGSIVASKIFKGDLVSWAVWFIDEAGELSKKKYYGTVINKGTELIGKRQVIVIKVYCPKLEKVLDLDPFKLQVEETN
jgi:hypothetical protein|tara:strand:+ start:1918 stop:2172 length:255 start_codon:yes stop_codon:yes gene_type:complete